jgi:hypothetical protein
MVMKQQHKDKEQLKAVMKSPLVIIVMELLTIDDSEKLLLGFQHIVAE